MAIEGGYAPPGVYTRTIFEDTNTNLAQLQGKVPTIIGVGKQTFQVTGSELVRGSSSTIDQRIVEEDPTGRMISDTNPDGSFVLSDFDGVLTEVYVRHFPIVTGDGTGTTSNTPSSVSATINGNATVIIEVDGANGRIRLAEAPSQGDDVRISYFFNRTDTFVEDEVLSSQVSDFQTEIKGAASTFVITAETNTLIITCDGQTQVLTLGVESVRADSLDKIENLINGAQIGSLTASTYVDQNGSENLLLSADGEIKIGDGTANLALGIYTNQQGTARNRTFFTTNGPIVDGSNGGVITTDVNRITVKVDDTAVQAESVDGANGSFTLASPPKVGSTVSVSYHHNTFQDKFDYIPGRDVKSLDRVSLVASGGGAAAQFIQDVDFVLSNDRIVWGTASIVSQGETQTGNTPFGTAQVSALLRDERGYLLECSPVVNTSVIPPRVLANTFKLPYQPVDGTGSGIPTSNPALIQVRTGVSFTDALENPVATVVRVDPATSQITLASAPPTNHKVFATFFYSILQDRFDLNAYNVAVESVGASGVGTYNLTSGTTSFFGTELTAKGVDLAEVVVNFPSGSEALIGTRFSGGVPVEEIITLEFGEFEATPAIFFAEGSASYYLVQGKSDTLNITVNAQQVVAEFDQPTEGGRLGNITHAVGEVLPYSVESNNQTLANGINASVDLVVDGKSLASSSITGNAQTANTIISAINTQAAAVPACYTAMSPFGLFTATNNSYKAFQFRYVGDQSGESATLTATLDEADYLNATALAGASDLANVANSTGVNKAIQTAIENYVGAGGAGVFDGLEITVEADTNNRLVFSLVGVPNQADGAAENDAFGYVEFIGADDNTFLSVAGIDYDVAGGTQSKWGQLPVASKVSTALGGGALRDRLILKNRTLIGNNYYPPVDLGISVTTGTNLDLMGISPTLNVASSRTSVLDKPSLRLTVGWDEVDDVDKIPAKTLYDGSTEDANNVLSITIDGMPFSIDLLAEEFGGGGLPANADGDKLDIDEISTKINTALGNHATTIIEGQYIRIVSAYAFTTSYIKVGAGSANSAFGLTEGTVVATKGLSAQALSDALNSSLEPDATIKDFLFSITQTGGDATKFGTNAVALIHTDAVGKQYLGFESLLVGVASILDVTGGNVASTRGTGLKITTDSGAVGEAVSQGYNLTSNNPNGTGSAGTSTIKNGVGADGRISQTYVDSVTGFTITILPREGGVVYPTGANATMTFNVSTSITTNANIPQYAIPGVSLIVSNTLDTAIGDNAIVETFFKGGKEPTIGQTYYIDFTRDRSSFNTRTFTNLADVVRTYGEISLENSLSMGAFLAFSNGATALACKQIQLPTGVVQPTEDQMVTALQEIEGEIVPGLSPSVIVPLLPASTALLSAISNHCDVQSSLRYRSERRAVLGCAVGTQPRDAQALSQATGNSRVCLIYPDIANIRFTNSQGVAENFFVGGEMIAVAVAMATSNPAIDSATPWTNRSVNGFTDLGRVLDDVDANATANAGITVLKQTPQGIQVRHGLTTNMTSVLTKTPTVVQIADDVHLRVRNLCQSYIGTKFVPNTISQIEGRVNNLFKQLVRDQIISTYTGLTVATDPNDPTGLLVDVFYKPVYPLLYIQFTFTVQGS
jgi:hypothetical protein